MDNQNLPLVSVIVITYNSSKYVLDTLESAKNQTYQKIELIVTDDCSTDNTVEICRNWIEENKDRFVRTELVTTENNTGVSANCNRGLNAATGEWIKPIAGDDALFSYAIEKVINYLSLHPEISILDTAIIRYKNTFEEYNIVGKRRLPDWVYAENMTAKRQHNLFLSWETLKGPSYFCKRKLLQAIGGYDERIRDIEDRPLGCNITKYGAKIYFYDLNTIKYRMHDSSFDSTEKGKIFNNSYKPLFVFYKTIVFPEINLILKMFYRINYCFFSFYDKKGLNNRLNKKAYLIYRIWMYISPIRLFIKMKVSVFKIKYNN